MTPGRQLGGKMQCLYRSLLTLKRSALGLPKIQVLGQVFRSVMRQPPVLQSHEMELPS